MSFRAANFLIILRLSKATQNTIPLQQRLVACVLIMRQAKKEITLGKLHEGCKARAKGPMPNGSQGPSVEEVD